MRNLFSTIFPFADFVYILQLEEYSSQRFFRWLPQFFFRRNLQERQQLVYTSRACIVLSASVALFLLLLAAGFVFFEPIIVLVVFIVLVVTIPGIIGIANLILVPVFIGAHERARAKATSLLASRRFTSSKVEESRLTVVMVAGSYGKTTTKSYIEQLCKHSYRIQVPPGNINTPSGIAHWIIRNLSDATTLLIIEADGYNRREYVQTLAMVPPDIAIITNIGDQHLERFGSQQELRDALGEVFSRTRSDAHLIASRTVMSELKDVLGSRQLHIVPDTLAYHGQPIEVSHLSASQQEDLALALQVADILNVPERFVVDAAMHLQGPERRQMHTNVLGYEGIDDSYNISVSTARASLEAATASAQKEHKKLLVVTAGIPELGSEVADGNKKLGSMLALAADHTVVLGSIFARDIAEGLGAASYTILPTLKEFQTISQTEWHPRGWFLLLLPELNDLYY